MNQNKHPYQKAIDYLNENSSKAHHGSRPYKLLFKLAQLHNIDMNGGQNNIMREFGYSKNKISKLVKDALTNFCITGKLVVPREFLFRKRKQYRHDGDSSANRNLWRESNGTKGDAKRREPVTYTYSSVKK